MELARNLGAVNEFKEIESWENGDARFELKEKFKVLFGRCARAVRK